MIKTQETSAQVGRRGRMWVAVTALAILPLAACMEHRTATPPEGPALQPNRALRPATRSSDAAELGVHVVGAVAEPTLNGILPGVSSLLDVLSKTRFTKDADLQHVVFIRVDGAGSMTKQIDLRELVLRGKTSMNLLLHAGDIIYIPTKTSATAARSG